MPISGQVHLEFPCWITTLWERRDLHGYEREQEKHEKDRQGGYTSPILPTRMSIFVKSSKVAMGVVDMGRLEIERLRCKRGMCALIIKKNGRGIGTCI